MAVSHVEFGHNMRKYFMHDPKWINLNHGSHGSYPKQVADARAEITHQIESATDKFLRYDYKTLLNKSRQRIADLLHVPVDECVLIQNATTALDTVFRNLTFEQNDAILVFETVYDAVEKSILCVQEMFPGLSIFKVGYKCSRKFRLPTSHAEIVSLFNDTIAVLRKEGYTIKVAVFDTISSVPAARFPFEQLTKICKEHKILSVIDGAHGVGMIPLDLASLDADFFVSNCHKWLFTPRSCAVLHVPQRNHHLIRNTVPTSFRFVPQSGAFITEASRGEKAPGFVELFQKIATMDETPLYCIPAALDFREQICGGEHAIYQYITKICQQGADVIAKELGTFVMGSTAVLAQNGCEQLGTTAATSAIPVTSQSKDLSIDHVNSKYTDSRNCAMATIALPLVIKDSQAHNSRGDVDSADARHVASWMQRILVDYNTTASIFLYEQRLWVRVMGQIYLELSDFEWFSGVLKQVCDRVKSGEPFGKKL